jgi:hypothetical protein
MSEFELQALTAIREHMAATVLLIDGLLDMPRGSEATPSECRHPEEKRIDASRMGWRGFMCGACREIIEVQTV